MAYVSPAVISSVENRTSGDVRLIVQFNGDAGEQPVKLEYLVGDATTIADVRRWVYTTIRQLNGRRQLSPVQGQSIPELAPPAPPAPTPKDVWLGKVNRYRVFAAVGLTGAAATALTALLADINATYQAGFLDA